MTAASRAVHAPLQTVQQRTGGRDLAVGRAGRGGVPEVHSPHRSRPSGLRERPRQARWKAPQQGPSHSTRLPGSSHSCGERAGGSGGPRARRPAEGGRPAPAPALTWHTCSFLAVAPRSDLLEEMDASVWVSSALSSGDSGGSSPGPSETWEEEADDSSQRPPAAPPAPPGAGPPPRARTGSGPPPGVQVMVCAARATSRHVP